MKKIDPRNLDVDMCAEHLGISARTLQVLVKRGILPKKSKGVYDLYAVGPAYMNHKLFNGPDSVYGWVQPECAEIAYERLQYSLHRIVELEGELEKLQRRVH